MIPMKNEQENSMKQLANKALRYSLSVVLIFVLLTLIGQAFALALYSTLAIACISGITYLTRSKT